MGSVSSVLAQAELTAATNTDIYTVPLGYTAVITTLFVSRSAAASAPLMRIAIRPGGEALANKHYIMYGYSAPQFLPHSVNLPLASGDVVTAYSDVTGGVVALFGTEEPL